MLAVGSVVDLVAEVEVVVVGSEEEAEDVGSKGDQKGLTGAYLDDIG